MEKIEKGIIYSSDILRILKGQNAINFNYNDNGLIIPSEKQIEFLRENFRKDVNKIFNNNVTIFSEEDMEQFLYSSLSDSWNCPHCFIR